MANYGDLIHAAITSAILAHEFKAISYSDSRTRVTTDVVAKVKTVKVDQRSSAFVSPVRQRLSRFTERASWTWVADIHFDRATSIEEFEDSVAQTPLRIPRDASDGRPQQVDIFLEEAEEYVHPPRKSPTTGTRARLRFVAELSPL